MITDKVLFQRAARGATHLDITHPGWWQEIDLTKLNIGSCTDCILGQKFGGYVAGLDVLGKMGSGGWDSRFGFEPSSFEVCCTDAEHGRRVKVLNAAWIEEINRRKAIAATPAPLVKATEPEPVPVM